jgi:hypothetical protein
MHEVIEQLSPEEDNIVVTTEEKKKRGRPKGSLKKNLITPLNDIQNSVDITS